MHDTYPLHHEHNDDRTEAQKALDFVYEHDQETVYPDDMTTSRVTVEDALRELQTRDSEDCKWDIGEAGSFYEGVTTGMKDHTFADGSLIRIFVIHDLESEFPAGADTVTPQTANVLQLSLTTQHPSDKTVSEKVSYRIGRDHGVLVCHVDRSFGANVASLMAMFDAAEVESGSPIKEMSEDDFSALLEGVIGESAVLGQDEDPDDDPMNVIRRGEDPIYRAATDSVRNAHAGKKLEEQLGINAERLVGEQEARQLVAFLQKL